jgi:hypothetical protein
MNLLLSLPRGGTVNAFPQDSEAIRILAVLSASSVNVVARMG